MIKELNPDLDNIIDFHLVADVFNLETDEAGDINWEFADIINPICKKFPFAADFIYTNNMFASLTAHNKLGYTIEHYIENIFHNAILFEKILSKRIKIDSLNTFFDESILIKQN